jgi:sec-independent protein translocase protein TatC
MIEATRPFLAHLEEFRQRAWVVLGWAAGLSVAAYCFSDQILAFVLRPLGRAVFLSPAEAFLVRMKLAVIVGGLLGLPIAAYELWQFTVAGLSSQERRVARMGLALSLALFYAGLFVGYAIMLPLGLRFLLGAGTGQLEPMISIGHYVAFAGSLVLAFGLACELPLALLLVTRLGWIRVEQLRQQRPIAVLIIFIVAAVLTPPDVVSQILLAIPLWGLFEASLWVASRWSPHLPDSAAGGASREHRDRPAADRQVGRWGR